MWMIWLQNWWELCTTYQPNQLYRWISGLSNLAIAIAYFWIPINMGIVFSRRKDEIPHPLLWRLYMTFISWCGITHLVHIWHAVFDPERPYMLAELAINTITGIISVGTAILFTYHLPVIMKYVSPKARQAILEKEIHERTAELREALSIKDVLFRELHHRVKNNLQNIISIINLHKKRASGPSEEAFEDLKSRIFAMGKIHDKLRELHRNKEFDVEDFLIQLCHECRNIYHKPNIECTINIDYETNFENATPLGLILNEIITNAFKHGFRLRNHGHLYCSMERIGDKVLMTIEDDGVGMENSKNHPHSNGIGMILVNKLKVQLNAEIYWDERPGGGTSVRMILPDISES